MIRHCPPGKDDAVRPQSENSRRTRHCRLHERRNDGSLESNADPRGQILRLLADAISTNLVIPGEEYPKDSSSPP